MICFPWYTDRAKVQSTVGFLRFVFGLRPEVRLSVSSRRALRAIFIPQPVHASAKQV